MLFLVDIYILFGFKKGVDARRILTEKFSNSDENPVSITLKNNYKFNIEAKIIDELPNQFQKRDFEHIVNLKPVGNYNFEYDVTPVERGEYHFGNLNIYVSSPLKIVARRFQFQENEMVAVYPSYIQMKKYEFLTMSSRLTEFGLKKIRRIGHTLEFEQIKNYIAGDDVRTINWKATAKRNQLMVNQYQDEKAQPIYSIIDLGRVMKMPFEGLSLLDYAINASLVISNVALKKQDKAGVFSFSRKVENKVVAERRPSQMNKILETLYNLNTDFVETDFSRLYIDIKRNLNQRSLLLLYTNFETLDALYRQLPYLIAIAKNHLLVVIFFENTELQKLTQKSVNNTFEIFEKTIAEKFIYEKKLIVNELQKHGIQSILTAPEHLTINTINKYLEIKARGML